MFSSKRFIIVGFTFKSVIQFEFIFVYGMRYELMLSLSLFFFYINTHVVHHNLLKRLAFLILHLCQNQLSISMGMLLGSLSITVALVSLDIR